MNFADMFNAPTNEDIEYDNFSMKDYNGEIVVFFPTEYLPAVETSFGTKDAVQTKVLIVSGSKAGKVYEDARVFQGAAIGILKRRIGGAYAGRIGQGVAKQKGFNRPWTLTPVTDAASQKATMEAIEAMNAAEQGNKIPF